MNTFFDCLPLEVINYVIRPCIGDDYFARVALNSLLPPVDRQGNRFRDSTVKQFELIMIYTKLQPLLLKVVKARYTWSKAMGITNVLDFLIKNPLSLQYNQNIRNRATTLVRETLSDVAELSKFEHGDAIKNLISKSLELNDLLVRTPLLDKLLDTLLDLPWSPIDGAGKHAVVNNVAMEFDNSDCTCGNTDILSMSECTCDECANWYYCSRCVYYRENKENMKNLKNYDKYIDIPHDWLSLWNGAVAVEA